MKTKLLFFLLILMTSGMSSFAQITIGSNLAPAEGALLDLKEKGVTTKGLGMPRVALTSKTGDLARSMGQSSAGIFSSDEHVGLLVYNTTQNMELCPGLYVWDGASWIALSPPKDRTAFDPASEILTDHEGNTYITSVFGAAGRWMTVNLRTKSFYPCYIIPQTGGNGYDKPTVGIPQNTGLVSPADGARIRDNGLLYNWAAATKMKGGSTGKGNVANESGLAHEQIQGVCPRGWHLPSDLEFTELENEIILYTSKYSSTPDIGSAGLLPTGGASGVRGTIHGKAMKLPGEPFDPGKQGTSFDATNKGFASLLVGCGWHSSSSSYTSTSYGTLGAFWSSSSFSDTGAWDRAVANEWTGVMKGGGSRVTQFSVRCKQNL